MSGSRLWSTLLLVCCIATAGNVAAAADFSVAYVKVPRLLAEPPQVKQVREKLRAEFTARDKKLLELQNTINELQDKLAQDRAFMSNNEVKRLERDILSRQLKLKHARAELKQERQLRQDDEVEHLRKIIREVIAEVAQAQKLDMVVETGVLWVSPRVDITDKVLERLQQMAADKGK